MFAAETPPTNLAPVRAATTAESIAWSKWVCTGSTASSRSTPSRCRPASILGSEGDNLPSPTESRLGREKKPSVSSALRPSSISMVVTPAQVMVTGDCGPAAGWSNRSA